MGVDALLGRQTRPHHDVDVLVDATDLERRRLCLIGLQFALKYTWDDEVRGINNDTWTSALEQPTAFVYGHTNGQEVDVHVVRQSTDGNVEALWNVPYTFTEEGLSGTGVVDGHPVRCLSREMQRQAHTGYDLPPQHLHDLELLNDAT